MEGPALLPGVGIGPAQLDQEEQIVSICLTTLPAFGRQALESKRVRLYSRWRLIDLPQPSGDYSCPSSFRVNFFRNIARVSTYFLDSRWFGALLI